MREVIVLAADRPDNAMPGLTRHYHYDTGNPERYANALEVRRLRAAAAATVRISEASAR